MSIRTMYRKLLNTYSNMALPVRASLWFVICNIIQKGISTITVPVFTRMMSTEEYGLYSIYNSWESIIIIFVTLRITYVAFNNGLIKYDQDIPRLTSTFQGLTTIIIVFTYALYLVFRDPINEFVGMNTVLISLMFVQMLVQPAFELWSARQRFEYKYKNMTLVTLGIAITNPILGVIGVYFSTNKALARIAAIVIVQLIFCGSLFVLNILNGKQFFSRRYWKFALLMSLPLLPHYLSTTIMNQADRIMIQKMCGYSSAAIYGVSHSAAYLVNLFTQAINNSVLPWTYQQLKLGSYKALYEKMHYIILVVASLISLIVAFGPDIIRILAPKEYHDAIWIIPPLSGGLYFAFIYQVFGNIEFFYEYKKPSLYIAIAATTLNLLTNYLFIRMFGYIAAGYTTFASYIFFALMHFLIVRNVIKKEIGTFKVYNYKAILWISIIFLFVLIIFTISYKWMLVRYSMITITCIVLLVYSEKIIHLIKTIR